MITSWGTVAFTGSHYWAQPASFVHFALDDRQAHAELRGNGGVAVPLLVNVSHSTLDGAIELARGPQVAGVAGVLVMPPTISVTRRFDPQFFMNFADAVVVTRCPYISTTFPHAPTESRPPL